MTESKRGGNAGRQVWAIWMLAVGLWIGMSIPALAAIPTTVTVDGSRGGDGALLLTATVTPAEAAGTVQFKLDGVDTGSPVAVTSGTAQADPIADLPPGDYTVGAEYSGDNTHEPGSASKEYTHTARMTPSMIYMWNPFPGPQLTPIRADIFPRSATGTVQFTFDGTDLGPPVPLVGGIAESRAIDIPDDRPFFGSIAYSGDALFEPATQTFNVDPTAPWEGTRDVGEPITNDDFQTMTPTASGTAPPASPSPSPTPVPAPAKEKTLPRTGSDPLPMALLAVALIGFGCLLVRAGRDEMLQSP